MRVLVLARRLTAIVLVTSAVLVNDEWMLKHKFWFWRRTTRPRFDTLSSVSYSFWTFDIDAPLLAARWLGDERGSRRLRAARSTYRSEMVAPGPTCRKAMPEVRARDHRWSRLRTNHVECQMSCSGSRQRLPNYGTSAIITDHPRLLRPWGV